MKYFSWFIILVVAVAIVSSFFVVGSPNRERLKKFDALRIDNLIQIQSEITDFYQAKGKVPATLDALTDPYRGVTVPVDPETGAAYEYTVKDDESFTLCATFNEEALAGKGVSDIAASAVPYPIKNVSWQHPAGHACFDRTIDKDYFKPGTYPAVVPQ